MDGRSVSICKRTSIETMKRQAENRLEARSINKIKQEENRTEDEGGKAVKEWCR